MPEIQPTFILRSKGKDLGTVTFESEDWPWNFGRFSPSQQYAEFAPVFEEAERLRIPSDSQRPQRDSLTRKIIEMELELIDEKSGDLEGEPDLLWIRGDRVLCHGHSGGLRETIRKQA